MLELPWQRPGTKLKKSDHWWSWVTGWLWAISGLFLGAVVAPSLIQYFGLWNTRFRDAADIGVAVIAGFLVQLLGWGFLILHSLATAPVRDWWEHARRHWVRPPYRDSRLRVMFVWDTVMFLVIFPFMVLVFLPFFAVGFALNAYLSLVGPKHELATTGFVGGLLVKVVVIPVIKSLVVKFVVVGVFFRRFMRWLRGKDATSEP